MKPLVLIEEFHINVWVGSRSSKAEQQSTRRTLNSRSFQAALNELVKAFFRRYRSLAKASVDVDR